MDAAVIASMLKWPNVPDCHGWLHLDAHGRWLMGQSDDTQKPSIVAHEGLKNFMNRNYIATDTGSWALQNGPQRVWVTLALAPLIVRLHAGQASAHTGQTVSIERVLVSDDGVVYFATDCGPAALDSGSMFEFSQGLNELDSGTVWRQAPGLAPLPLEACAAAGICAALGFKRHAHAVTAP
jgi:Protein of unknown function (DUF2946)